jgi:hypothetical protein
MPHAAQWGACQDGNVVVGRAGRVGLRNEPRGLPLDLSQHLLFVSPWRIYRLLLPSESNGAGGPSKFPSSLVLRNFLAHPALTTIG